MDIADSWLSIHIDSPMQSINSGASVEIDVTSMLDTKLNIIERRNNATKQFPHGCVKSKLVTTDGAVVMLTNVSESVTDSQTHLVVRKPNSQRLNVKFSALSIRAYCPISGAKIYWRNASE